jgi:tetratricopeptide (TPR) repeat protein
MNTIRISALLCAAVLLLASGCAKRTVVGPVASPAPAVTGPQSLAHTVREGETLSRIADLYYGDPARAEAIAAANGVTSETRLGAGSVLLLHFLPQEYDLARRRAAALEPYNRGVTALAAGDLTEAERQFRLALHTVPDLADARYNLALVLLRRGQAEAAADLLRPLVRERPAETDFGFALGNALFQQTRFLEAAQTFARVLADDPTHRRAAFGHARALTEAGSRQEAIAAWQRYLELDSASSWAVEARRHLRELRGG